MALLDVQELVVRFRTHEGTVYAVNGVSFQLDEGETLGLVGESGCGKSVTSLAIMRLLAKPAGRIEGGRVTFDGADLTALREAEMRDLRGRELAMIFQDPMTSLNPVLTIEEQMVETIRAHASVSPAEARERAVELLGMVGIAQPKTRLRDYPHQFSGGMRQRVMIAMALALRPKLLIADEPTTALDVTIQAQVLELLRELTAQGRTAAILITHDLGVVAGMTQRINVMYAGFFVETATTADLFVHPSHPYTVGLLHSIPRLDAEADADEPLVPIEGAPPDQRHAPKGCPFAPRCAWRLPICWSDNPTLESLGGSEAFVATGPRATHRIACHNPPTAAEAEAGGPLREGFTPAPPPSAVVDELVAAAMPAGEEGLVTFEEPFGPGSRMAGIGGLPIPPAIGRRADESPEEHHPAAQLRRGPAVTLPTPPAVALSAMPAPDVSGRPLVKVDELKVHFPITNGILFGRHVGDIRAVDGISFTLRRGETLGLVGESGCGKSTTGRALIRLCRPTAGRIEFDGMDLTHLEGAALRRMRRRMQMIFQDPYASLDPRMTVQSIVAEPLEVHGIGARSERDGRVRELLATVGINPDYGDRYPHEFSGGQCQRVGVARALALNPDFIVADEPISALDVSIRAQIINLLERLQGQFGLTYLFIAHDLSVVRHISDRIAVMYVGRIVELASSRELNRHPLHPYAVALLSAIPVTDPAIEGRRRRMILKGDVPSPANPPSGCRFHPRCWLRERLGNPARCVEEDPALRAIELGHEAACHFAESVDGSAEQVQATGRVPRAGAAPAGARDEKPQI